MEDGLVELTKLLIKQDLKDKSGKVEYLKIPKKEFLRIMIKIYKYILEFE